jgi:hypothetical protein
MIDNFLIKHIQYEKIRNSAEKYFPDQINLTQPSFSSSVQTQNLR